MWFDRFRSTRSTAKAAEIPTTSPARATRFRLEVPVAFVAAERRHEGCCINVSSSGLLARFDDTPELWINGKVELEAGEHYLSIHARVARLQGNEAGIAFLLNTDNDRAAIAILLGSVLDNPQPELSGAESLQPHHPRLP